MPIIVDSREPRALYDNIKKLLPDTQRATLQAGDYMWESPILGLVLIERKEVSDLVASVISNGLTEQARKMAAVAKMSILLIEGWMTCTYDGSIRTKSKVWRVRWNYLQNYLLGIQSHGFYLDYSPNQTMTVRRIVSLHEWSNREEHESLRGISIPPGAKYDPLKILSSFPGFNIVLADRMWKQFGTLRNIFNADWKKLIEVDGIGDVKAKSFTEVLDEVESKSRGTSSTNP